MAVPVPQLEQVAQLSQVSFFSCRKQARKRSSSDGPFSFSPQLSQDPQGAAGAEQAGASHAGAAQAGAAQAGAAHAGATHAGAAQPSLFCRWKSLRVSFSHGAEQVSHLTSHFGAGQGVEHGAAQVSHDSFFSRLKQARNRSRSELRESAAWAQPESQQALATGAAYIGAAAAGGAFADGVSPANRAVVTNKNAAFTRYTS